MADGGHVLWPGPASQAAEVFVEDHVGHPVQPVPDVPVAADGGGEQLGIEWERRQEVAPFVACGAIALDLCFDHGDGAQAREARLARMSRRVVVSQPTSWLA